MVASIYHIILDDFVYGMKFYDLVFLFPYGISFLFIFKYTNSLIKEWVTLSHDTTLFAVKFRIKFYCHSVIKGYFKLRNVSLSLDLHLEVHLNLWNTEKFHFSSFSFATKLDNCSNFFSLWANNFQSDIHFWRKSVEYIFNSFHLITGKKWVTI